MAIKFANLASTTLASAITSSATTLTVASASGFPSLGAGDYFYASLGEGTLSEIVKVTGISGTTFTITRAQDGTTASSWSSGDTVALRVVAAALDDLAQAADTESVSISGDTMTGNLTVPNLSITSTNWLGFGDYGERISGSNGNSSLTFSTNATQALQLDSSQNAIFAGTISSGAITSRGDSGSDSIMRIRNTNSTSKTTRLQFEDSSGTVGDALIAFVHSDSNSANHYLGMGVNNSTAFKIDNSDNATFAGTISSGAITSSGNITATNQININSASYDNRQIGMDSNGFFIFNSADSRYDLTINDSGAATFGGTLLANGTITAQSGKFATERGSAAAPTFTFSDDTDTGMYNVSNADLGFAVGGSSALLLDSSLDATFGGSITLGQSEPINFSNSNWQIYSDGNDLVLKSSDDINYYAGWQRFFYNYPSDSPDLGNVEYARIGSSSGNWLTGNLELKSSGDFTARNSTFSGTTTYTGGNTVGGIFMNYSSNGSASYRGYFDWRTLQLGNNGVNNIIAGNSSTGGYFDFWVNATSVSQSGGTSGTKALTLASNGSATFFYNVTAPSFDFSGTTGKIYFGSGTDDYLFLGDVSGGTNALDFVQDSVSKFAIDGVTGDAYVKGRIRTADEGIYGKMSSNWHTDNAMRGGNFSANIGNDTTVLKLFPASPSDESGNGRTVGDYSTGIGFMHLDPDSSSFGSSYQGMQAWIGLRFYNSSGQERDYLSFATTNTYNAGAMPIERMVISPEGYVGINDGNPEHHLDVGGAFNFVKNVVPADGGEFINRIRNSSTSWGSYAVTRYGAEGEDARYMDFGYYRGTTEATRGLVIRSQAGSTLHTFLDSGDVQLSGITSITKAGTKFTPLAYDGLIIQNSDATGIRIIDSGDAGNNGGHTAIGNDNGNLRLSAAGTISLATGLTTSQEAYSGGTTKLTVTGSGVGIGIGAPTALLDVRGNVRIGDGSSSEQDIIFVAGSGNWQAGTNNGGNGTNNNQFFIYDDAYRFTVQKGTGRIGLGTSTPSYRIHSVGSGHQRFRLEKTDAGGDCDIQLYSNSDTTQWILFGDRTSGNNSGAIIYSHVDNDMSFRTNDGSDRLVIDSSGYVHAESRITINQTNDYTASLSNIKESGLAVQSSGFTQQTLSFVQHEGNWTDGNTGNPVSDTRWGLMWHYQGQIRAGIDYDHRGVEKFDFYSSYGDIRFRTASSYDGDESPVGSESSMPARLTVGMGGQITIRDDLHVGGAALAPSGMHNILNRETKEKFTFTGYPNANVGGSPKYVADEINRPTTSVWYNYGYQTSEDASNIAWLSVDCLDSYCVTHFAVSGYPGGSHKPTGNFYLQGSSDNSTWTTIGTADPEQWVADSEGTYPFRPHQIVECSTTTAAYRYFRIYATGWTNGYLLMFNWGLFVGGNMVDSWNNDIATGRRIGVGTEDPSYPLEIEATDAMSIAYQRTGASAKKWGFDSDNDATYWVNVTDGTRPIKLTNGGDLQMYNSAGGVTPALRATNFGYSTGYRVIQVGATSGADTVSIGYDPSGNTSGSFGGYGGEVLFRNGVQFTTPNSANNSYHSTLRLNDGNVLVGTTSGNASCRMVVADADVQVQLKATSNSGFIDFDGTNLQFSTNRDLKTGAFSDTTKSNASLFLNGGTSGSSINFYTASSVNTTATSRMFIDSTGLVKMYYGGLFNNSVKIDYTGNGNNGSDACFYIIHDSADWKIKTEGRVGSTYYDYGIYQLGTGSYAYYQSNSGTVTARIDYSGNAIFAGNVTAYGSPSDIRLKENIETIPNALEKVQRLRGVTFNYKKDGSRSTGLIAQELIEVLPEAVYEPEDIDPDDEKFYAVRYGNTVGLLVEAIKELKQENDELKEMLKSIMEKLDGN